MKKVKSILKYIGATAITLFLIILILLTGYFYRTDAPITNGKVHYNITYKVGLKLDLYTPTKKTFGKSPVIFYIHGGAWIIGDKFTINSNRFNGAIHNLREQGYTIISPNYTLGKKGKSPFPACIVDIYKALDWVENNAHHYNLDTKNIGILGESAGAQIAMMVAFSDNYHGNKKYNRPNISYLIDVYGPSNLSSVYSGPEITNLNKQLNNFLKPIGQSINIEEYVFGFDPAADSLRANSLLDRYSPLKYLKKNNFPTLIIHGMEDQIVALGQSLALNSKMNSLGIVSEMHLIEGVDHSFRKATKVQKDVIQFLITDFVVKNYKHYNLTQN